MSVSSRAEACHGPYCRTGWPRGESDPGPEPDATEHSDAEFDEMARAVLAAGTVRSPHSMGPSPPDLLSAVRLVSPKATFRLTPPSLFGDTPYDS